jgi:hypothetical protein
MIASPRAGLILVALIAFNPILARFDVGIEPAVIGITLMSAAMYLLIDRDKSRMLRFCLAGLLAAAVNYIVVDFTGLPIFLVCAVVLAEGFRASLRSCPLFIAAYLLALIPLAAVNYAEFGRVMIAPSCLGRGLIQGLGEMSSKGVFELPSNYYELLEYEGYFVDRPEERARVGEELIVFYPNPMERDAARRAKACQVMMEHPMFVLKGMLRKIPLILTGKITGINPARLAQSARDYQSKDGREPYVIIVPPLYLAVAILFRNFYIIEWATIVLALVGFYVSRGMWRMTIVVAALPLYFFAGSLLIAVEKKPFTTALPFIYVFTAVGIDALTGGRRAWRHSVS